MKRTPLKPGAPPRRRTTLRQVNPELKREREGRAFGRKAEWVRTFPCVVCGRAPVDAAHVRSRGAGGTSEDLIPLCRECHSAQHQMGIRTFERRHVVDLAWWARVFENAWHRRGSACL